MKIYLKIEHKCISFKRAIYTQPPSPSLPHFWKFCLLGRISKKVDPYAPFSVTMILELIQKKYQISWPNLKFEKYIEATIAYGQNNKIALTTFGPRTRNSFGALVYKWVLSSPLEIFHKPDWLLDSQNIKNYEANWTKC